MLDLSNRDIILHFQGHLDYDIIGELIGSLKERMRKRKVRFGLYKKILTVMIESLENIIRYRGNLGIQGVVLDKYPPEFVISSNNERVYIESINALFNPDIELLQQKLSQLNELDPKELKELYKQTITNGKFSDKGGAGLGIIEMAKIADEKIIFRFEKIDEKLSYFYLCLVTKKRTSKSDDGIY
jgi:hypothetical protein